MQIASRLLGPVSRRVSNLFSRGTVKATDDSKKLQILQVGLLAEETRADIERPQPYGFTSSAKDGAEAFVIFVNGQRDHGLAICVEDRRYRIKNLDSGEVAVYDATGSKIVLKANGDIQLVPSSGKVKVTGDLEATGDVKAGAISLKNHTHNAGTLLICAASGSPATGTTGGPL